MIGNQRTDPGRAGGVERAGRLIEQPERAANGNQARQCQTPRLAGRKKSGIDAAQFSQPGPRQGDVDIGWFFIEHIGPEFEILGNAES